MAQKPWSVYIARCADGSLYTGVAVDVLARLAAHNSGRGAAYTRARRPVRLVYREDGMTRSAALSREAGIKSLERGSKLAIVKAARAARKVLAAAVLLLAAGAAMAAPTFDKENPVAFSSATPQAFTGTYPSLRMYFIRPASGTEVGSALSADGVNWLEDAPGGRLSTATLPTVSASSITGCGVLPLSGGGFRMLYSIVTPALQYRIHSATSADGLAWANDAGTRVDNGLVYLAGPKLIKLSDASWRMYYVGSVGAGVGNRRVFSARSVDQGLTWSAPSVVIATTAFEVGASILTNNKVRLYYTEPAVGGSSGTEVLSALSTDVTGTAFNLEAGVPLSTSTTSGTLSNPVPVIATDTFRWRLYYAYYDPAVVSTPDIHTALTGAPAPVTLSPASVLNIQSTVTFTVSGDIFSLPAPTAFLSLNGQPNITAANLTRVNDQTLTMTFNVLDQISGLWDLTITNADTRTATLARALFIDFSGGSVSLVNNLIRPAAGVPVTISIDTFTDGRIVARLYTLDGRAIRTLYDAQTPKGILNLTWNGFDSNGGGVASGVYLLHVTGPKLDAKKKIVLIR